jgi:hypothetical protein
LVEIIQPIKPENFGISDPEKIKEERYSLRAIEDTQAILPHRATMPRIDSATFRGGKAVI